jgi:hypothetical protein
MAAGYVKHQWQYACHMGSGDESPGLSPGCGEGALRHTLPACMQPASPLPHPYQNLQAIAPASEPTLRQTHPYQPLWVESPCPRAHTTPLPYTHLDGHRQAGLHKAGRPVAAAVQGDAWEAAGVALGGFVINGGGAAVGHCQVHLDQNRKGTRGRGKVQVTERSGYSGYGKVRRTR